MKTLGILWAMACLFWTTVPTWAQDQPIKIGVQFIMSGKLGGYGQNAERAIKMAMEEINSGGGIMGRKLEAVFADTQLKPDILAKNAEKFVKEDKVDFLMGPTSSGLAPAFSDFARKHKKILVVTQAAGPELTGPLFHPYVFGILSNAMMHSRAGAYVVASMPHKRWMCVGPDYNYGHTSWAIFKTKLKELKPDAEFIGEVFPKLMEPDYASFIQKVVEMKPDAVWCPLWGDDAVRFIRQALPHKLFETIKFAFPVGAALETVVPLGKDTPEGILMASRYFFTTPDSDTNRKFVKAYFEKYKEYPDYMAEETYAGVYFLKAAIERAKSVDADKIVKAVEREPLAWETPEGWKIIRKEDHQVVEDVVWGETAFNEKYGFAILKNIQSIQGEQIGRTNDELREVRTNYEKRLKEGK
ncbi:MAG: ABC transporter substrate-binding protein [Desulfomonilaceae bacterium]